MSVSNLDDAFLKKLKQTITARLAETRDHVEKELPEYIMSMITNKKTKNYMHKNLEAFIGEDAMNFCDWVFDLVEKINETSVPNIPQKRHDPEPEAADHGSAPANVIKEVKEEKEKENRHKQSSSGTNHRDSDRSTRREVDDSRKRKIEEERKTRVPIEAPRRDRDRKVSSRRESERDRDRERDSRRVEVQDRRRNTSGRERKSTSPWRKSSSSHREPRRESTSQKKTIRYESESSVDDEEDFPVNSVVSKVVASRRVDAPPTVSSQVTVKRNVRKMGDDKLMKARSSMFMKALSAASASATGEPAAKKAARIVERTDSSGDRLTAPKGSIEDRIVRVRLDVSKPPTKRMEAHYRKHREQKTASGSGDLTTKRKHDAIVYDIPNRKDPHYVEEPIELDYSYDEDYDEGEIDRILEEVEEEEGKSSALISQEEPPKKRIADNVNFVANQGDATDMGALKKKVRCSFWPKCGRGEGCLFLHPNSVCSLFPKCSYGNKCHYVHPPCKFTTRCLNKQCPFVHADAETIQILSTYFPSSSFAPKNKIEISANTILPDIPLSQGPSIKKGMSLCRYAESCCNPMCKFDHPTLCRFGDQCINTKCAFFHPPAPLPPKNLLTMTKSNMYKWSAGAKP